MFSFYLDQARFYISNYQIVYFDKFIDNKIRFDYTLYSKYIKNKEKQNV